MRALFLFFIGLVFISTGCSALPALSSTGVPEDLNAASGSILFEDNFSRPLTGWNRLQVDGGVMDYDGGGYRFLINALNTNFWSTPHRNYSDVRLEVDTGKLAGPDENRIGLLCRFNGNDYYFFLITSDGFYGVGVFLDGNALLLGQSELRASANIRTGMAINHLRADCAGDTLTFYINGFENASVHDSTLKSGDIGLLAGTFGQPGVDVIFDNFVVMKP
jgi:hypothetical protein